MTPARFIEQVASEQEPLRRFLLMLTSGNRVDAEDIAQESLIKAYLASGRFEEKVKFRTWLFKIAYRTFLDRAKGSKPAVEPLDERLEGGDAADEAFRYEALYQAITRLPEKSRAAVILYHLEGYTMADIAIITHSNPLAVRQRLSRGLRQLKNILDK